MTTLHLNESKALHGQSQDFQMISVLSALCYFNVFRHPLTQEEVHRNAHYHQISLADCCMSLQAALDCGTIKKQDRYYYIGEESNVARRLSGEDLAGKTLAKIRALLKLTALFPFVRAVMISGSVSKGYMDKKSDVDYFIIVEPGRLWICRTLLVMFKKIFLLNSHKYFCLNYFIDNNNLEIGDKNIFTATELVYLMPVYGMNEYKRFMAANKWAFENYYPNFVADARSEVRPSHLGLKCKKLFELLFGVSIFNYVEKYLQNVTVRFWTKKFKNAGPSWFTNRIENNDVVSKLHPNDYRTNIMQAYNARLQELSCNIAKIEK